MLKNYIMLMLVRLVMYKKDFSVVEDIYFRRIYIATFRERFKTK